jgi:general stress protein CsbA
MNIKYKVILIYKQIKAGILEGLYIVINDVSDAPAGFFYVYNKDNRFKLMLD